MDIQKFSVYAGGVMKNVSLTQCVGLRRACIFPDTLTDGVPKVPKGWRRDFCHFWHCLI